MRNTYIIAILALSLSWGQGLSGLAGKAKEKLQAVEKDIKNTFAKLEVKTNSEFVDNSTKYDFDKRTLTSPDRDRVFKEIKKEWKFLWLFPVTSIGWEEVDNTTADDLVAQMVHKMKVEHEYSNFGDIGSGVTINNLSQSYFQEDFDKSDFWTGTVSRFYSFEVTEGSDNTVCECTAETSRKVVWPLIFKNRKIFTGPLNFGGDALLVLNPFKWFGRGWNPIRDMTQKLQNNLNCTIYNGSEKYDLNLDFSEYKVKTKLTIPQRITSKILPKSWRDNGERFKLSGTIKNDKNTYTLSTNYDYDLSILSDNSPFRAMTPPTSYTVVDEDKNYAIVKHPSHFQISKDYENNSMQGILYGAILSAYFYQPLGGKGNSGTYESNIKKVEAHAPNTFAEINQTKTWKGNTKKGKKRAAAYQKNHATTKKVNQASGKMNQMFGDDKEQPEVKGYENERNHMDLYYNASRRGPLGLY